MPDLKNEFPSKIEPRSNLKQLARNAENMVGASSSPTGKGDSESNTSKAWYHLSWLELPVLAASLLLAVLIIPKLLPKDSSTKVEQATPKIDRSKKNDSVTGDGDKKTSKDDEKEKEGKDDVEKNAEGKLSIQEKLKKKVSFEFSDVELLDAIGVMVDATGAKISIESSAIQSGHLVNLTVTNMNAHLAIKWIARMAQLKTSIKDNALKLHTSKQAIIGEPRFIPITAVSMEYLKNSRFRSQLKNLVTDLTNEDFAKRMIAEKQLLTSNLIHLPALQEALACSTNAEIRLRLSRVVGSLKRKLARQDAIASMAMAVNEIAEGKHVNLSSSEIRKRQYRKKLLELYGGNATTELAVKTALQWLATHQEADGHWNIAKYGGKKADVGITGLCLLAFLGNGHTERIGKYKAHVYRAVKWLRSIQRQDGCLYIDGETHGIGYHHGIAGLALAEAAGMSKIPTTVSAAQQAIDYSTKIHQNRADGNLMGWRYSANSKKSDICVSGWFILQLEAARTAGLNVSNESLTGASRFLDSVEAEMPRHRYGYTSPKSIGNRRTAIGCLSRKALGWNQKDLKTGVQWFVTNGGLPDWGPDGAKVDFYYLYFGTLATFQQGGPIWHNWNKALKKTLVDNQRRGGDEDGSWDPVGAYSQYWGRTGQTAIGALNLEVYYRYPRITNNSSPIKKKEKPRPVQHDSQEENF